MVCCYTTFSAILVLWLIAVLCKPFVAATDRHSEDHQFNRGALNESTTTYSEMQSPIREEGGEDGLPVDCCPTIEEMVEPQGGHNLQGMYVELYRDGDNAQRFFEYSCRPDVLDKPCRFIDRELQAQSRCVQMYSYTYAIFRAGVPTRNGEKENTEESQPQQQQEQPLLPMIPDNNDISSWTLGYIKVRSGCSCKLLPKRRKACGGEDQQDALDFNPEV